MSTKAVMDGKLPSYLKERAKDTERLPSVCFPFLSKQWFCFDISLLVGEQIHFSEKHYWRYGNGKASGSSWRPRKESPPPIWAAGSPKGKGSWPLDGALECRFWPILWNLLF